MARRRLHRAGAGAAGFNYLYALPVNNRRCHTAPLGACARREA